MELGPHPTRILATVLFTDIVDSTGRASRLGDRRWRELLNVHDELARREVEEFGGHWSRPPATGCWRPSTDRDGRSAARPRSETSWLASASRSERGCTPARLNSATAMSAGSLFTSRLG
jgi:class 3 adenylate cyclase